MIWPFSRRKKAPPPPVDGRFLNEDWRAGDDAVCVCDCFTPSDPIDPRKGERLRVSAIVEGMIAGENTLAIGLKFEGKPQGIAWRCLGFRKLRKDERAADTTFSAWLKAKGPHVGEYVG